jgi:hypothetical protein
LPWDETFDGSDTGTPVDDHDYQVPFAFTGKIGKLTITVAPPKLTPEDLKKLEAANRAAQRRDLALAVVQRTLSGSASSDIAPYSKWVRAEKPGVLAYSEKARKLLTLQAFFVN